ncbi:hypothetical protein BC826DRAFT_580422 [Russula brevipes]|nr:hypothetical protein BC826DRAFT_580422 [Russula brevipes]
MGQKVVLCFVLVFLQSGIESRLEVGGRRRGGGSRWGNLGHRSWSDSSSTSEASEVEPSLVLVQAPRDRRDFCPAQAGAGVAGRLSSSAVPTPDPQSKRSLQYQRHSALRRPQNTRPEPNRDSQVMAGGSEPFRMASDVLCVYSP